MFDWGDIGEGPGGPDGITAAIEKEEGVKAGTQSRIAAYLQDVAASKAKLAVERKAEEKARAEARKAAVHLARQSAKEAQALRLEGEAQEWLGLGAGQGPQGKVTSAVVPHAVTFTAPIPKTADVPVQLVPVPGLPEGMEELSSTQQKAIKALLTLTVNNEIIEDPLAYGDQAERQSRRVQDRCSSEQWLDENEREWYVLDELLRSRPWATRKDEAFPYPFRTATNEMRDTEGPWIGDEEDPPKRVDTRTEVPSAVLVHMRQVAEHPPSSRVILFTPEFGSEHSYDAEAWGALAPVDSCDMWVVSWQGWVDFEEMIAQVSRKVLSFADAVSTVWFGHSMGALVAYELLKRFEKHHSPNYPVALAVSGCPAPHLFEGSYRPYEKYQWLRQLRVPSDLAALGEGEYQVLENEFQMASADSEHHEWAILADLKMMRAYRYRHAEGSQAVACPVVAFCHDEDELVDPPTVEAWRAYAPQDSAFECVALEDYDDGEETSEQGHGFAYAPCWTMLEKLAAVGKKYQLSKDIADLLPDIGPTDGPVPEEIDCVVVGAGIAGVTQAKVLLETKRSVVIFDRYATAGGIWTCYANTFSRVNSSEPAYRIVDQQGVGSRPNEDHSPTHDILRDIFTIAAKYCYGMFRCNMDVTDVRKREDRSYDVSVRSLLTGAVHMVHAQVVSFNVNRRIGKRRDVTFPQRSFFRGEEVYGYANEVRGLNFWGKNVVVIGAGAFAFENLRTSLEHGAKHVTILGRRSGTTCPKWIDMIAFLRPRDKFFMQHKNGNVISFDCWKKCYEDAGLDQPECWEEGLLKPNNHTISVSDIAFIGGHHGMVDLRVGEIRKYLQNGQGVELKDGSTLNCDIIIKATGFHINAEVAGITGRSKMHPSGLIDFNLMYGAEPLLDGGQFGAKGITEVDFEGERPDQEDVEKGLYMISRLGLPDFTPRGNPFGSAYVGGMMATANLFRWLVENPDYQQCFLELAGKPTVDVAELWASQIPQGQGHLITKLATKLL